MAMAARRARRILTVSQASKDDILHFLKVPASKVESDPQRARRAAGDRPRRRRTSPECAIASCSTRPFVLYAGNIKPHKNVERLIEAFALLRARGGENIKLLIIGDEISKYPNLRRLVHRFQLHQHVRFLGFVPDATLAALYRLATVFVFPSLYEGFGLPPLEAMASGTPVITSNVSSLPEVVGDAALLIDPMNAVGDRRCDGPRDERPRASRRPGAPWTRAREGVLLGAIGGSARTTSTPRSLRAGVRT